MVYFPGSPPLSRLLKIASGAAVLCTGLAILYYRCLHLQLDDAYVGLSPRLVALAVLHPEKFAPLDFPSGVHELLNSPIMWVYPAASYLGIDIYFFSYLMIAVEVLALATLGEPAPP